MSKNKTTANNAAAAAEQFRADFMARVKANMAGRSASVQAATLTNAEKIAHKLAEREDAADFLPRAVLLNRDSSKKAARILQGGEYCSRHVFEPEGYGKDDASVAVLAAAVLNADGECSRKAAVFHAVASKRYRDTSGAQMGYARQALAFCGIVDAGARSAPVRVLDRARLESLIPAIAAPVSE